MLWFNYYRYISIKYFVLFNIFLSLHRMKGFRYILQYYTHQGSVAALTNSHGEFYQHLQYLPYGDVFVDKHDGSSFTSPYTFSAKEKDSESGYTNFGERYYYDNIMMWLSVDPMSDERPWISPYNYCQWNPIGRVDTWGMLDEIVIRAEDGTKTTYVPGMSSEGYDDFTAQVINNYNEAYSGSATAREDIDNLVNAKGNYYVQKYKDNNFRKGRENGNKAGTIYYNPEGTEVPTQQNPYSVCASNNPPKDPICDLIHETIHASRYEQGINIPRDRFTTGTTTPDEEIATMHRKNMFRSEFRRDNGGTPLRTHYAIIKSGGRIVGASGFQMLDNMGGVIKSRCPDYLR
ncbi:MAG: hypothetical protein IKJ56_07485 [Bacteroidales bacterium]|nr:hypothetical protein [Bacteroidales bacterium]